MIDDLLAFPGQTLRFVGRLDQRLRRQTSWRGLSGGQRFRREKGRRRTARLLDGEPVEIEPAHMIHHFARPIWIAAQFDQRRAAKQQRRFERFANLVMMLASMRSMAWMRS